jgi:hypothetical protein
MGPPPTHVRRPTRLNWGGCHYLSAFVIGDWPQAVTFFIFIRRGKQGDQNMGYRKMRNTVEDDQPTETKLEGEIREFVRSDVVTNRKRQPESDSELVASNINQLLQRVAGTSVQEIDRLITEMQTLRDALHSEAARVQSEIVQYSALTRAALESTKIIAESLTQFKRAPDAPALPDLKDRSVAS